jgi:O-antigen ligase
LAILLPAGSFAALAVAIGLQTGLLTEFALASVGGIVVILAAWRFGFLKTMVFVTLVLLPLNGVRFFGLAAADFGLVISLAAALFVRTTNPRVQIPQWVALPLYLLTVSALVASTASPFPAEAIAATFRLAVAAVLCVVLVFRLAPTPRDLGVWLTAFSIGQAISVIEAHINPPQYSDRLDGLATHANTFGLLSALALVALVPRLQRGRGSLAISLDLVLIGTSAVGVLSSGSRAAIFAVAAGLGAFALTGRRVARTFLIAGIVGPLLIVPFVAWQITVPGSATQRLLAPTDFETQSNNGRIDQAEYAIARWEQQPLLGGGMDIGAEAHNVYLQLLTAAGPLALAMFIVFAVSLLSRLLARGDFQPPELLARRTLVALLLCYLVAAAVSNNLWDRFIWIILGIAAFYATIGAGRRTLDNPKFNQKKVLVR